MIYLPLLAYLIGSIPFGLLIMRAAGLGDIRTQGSGNIGATNVLRSGGKKLGIAVLLLDMGKGALAIGIVPWMLADTTDLLEDPEYFLILIAQLYAVIIGHVFPVWLKFRGGKGVATLFGALLAFDMAMGGIFASAWLIVFGLTRYVSIASMAATTTAALSSWFFYGTLEALLYFLPLIPLVLFTHRSNIKRILNGTESRFSRS